MPIPSPASSSCPLVSVRDVTVTLGGVRALNGVSLDVRQGQHLALTGPNGAGKSTLLRLLRGEIRPDQTKEGYVGTVVWFPPDNPDGDDSPLTGRSQTALISPALQELYVRQGWTLTGEELILAGLYDDHLLYRRPEEEQRLLCRNLAERLHAETLLARTADTLSQGQLRSLILLRALIRKPRLLLLDEAADGLDSAARHAFFGLLEELTVQPNAPTMILSTHRSDLPAFVTETLCMEQGRLVGPFPLPTDEDDNGQNVQPVLTVSSCQTSRTGMDADSPIVSLRGVTVFIERVEILHDISWDIRPGEQWMVTGGNGAGKSTLLRLIAGEELVAWGGTLIRRLPRHGGVNPPLSLIQQGIRMVSDRLQALYTYDETALDVVFSGLEGSVGVYREATATEKAEAYRCLEVVGLAHMAQRPFRSLSTGQARRVLLARALVGEPELILLDEPFSGLDRESRTSMRDLLESRMTAGVQVILVSHHEGDRLTGITHTAFMEGGKLRFRSSDPMRVFTL